MHNCIVQINDGKDMQTQNFSDSLIIQLSSL